MRLLFVLFSSSSYSQVGKKNLDDFNIGLVSKKDIFCDAVFNQCATEREEEYKEYKEEEDTQHCCAFSCLCHQNSELRICRKLSRC